MAGQMLRESQILREHFQCNFVNLSLSSDVRDIGCFTLYKLVRMTRLLMRSLFLLLTRRYQLAYMSPSPTLMGFLKELPLYLLVRLSVRRRVFHFHAKGLAAYHDRWCWRHLIGLGLQGGRAIVLGLQLKNDVRPWFGESRLHVLPYGIPEQYRERTEFSAQVRFIFLGNLIESKGFKVALQAAQQLRKKGLPFKLTLVGAWVDIDPESFRREVERLELTGFVDALGPRYGTEKEQILANSDVLVFPTYYDKETFGLVILEAMRQGLPVISTDNGAISETIIHGETGFLVPARDSSGLAERMEQLLRDAELRQRLGEAGRRRFLQKFTLEHFETGILAIFQEALKN